MPAKKRFAKVVAVDWDTRTLRIVHAQLSKRGVKVEKLLSVPIGADVDPFESAQMGGLIRRTLDQEGISTRRALVDVPRDQAILKTLTLPTTQREALPDMVRIQIAKELPFAITEAVVDYAVSPDADNQPAGDVLVSAIRRELLEQFEATFAAAGLRLERAGLRPYAHKVAVSELLRHALPERVVYIDVRPTFMEIDVLRRGALSFSRSASVTIPRLSGDSTVFSMSRALSGAEAPMPPAEGEAQEASDGKWVLDSLVLEVTRSIEAYRVSEPGARIDHVVIGGDVGVEESLAEALQKRLGVTTELYNPASTFGWEPDEGAAASAFAASLGLVLGHADTGALHFDFLHPKRAVSATQRRLRKAPVAAAVVVLFVGAGAVALSAMTRDERMQLARLEQSVEEMLAKRKDHEAFLELVAETEAFDAGQLIWVDLLYDVFSLLPPNDELVVSHLEMRQSDGRIKLKTRTKSRDTPTQVVRTLEEFRPEGERDLRFRVFLGPQTEKPGDTYAYHQDLEIIIVQDDLTAQP